MTTTPSTRSLILIPAIITLAVTGLRLGLELGGGPQWLANADAGGPGAVIGVVWLPLIFGPYFAHMLRPHFQTTGAFVKRLAFTLWIYGLAARIPVILVSIPAILGDWGTHYERFPPEMGELSAFAKIGMTLGAQTVLWATVWTIGSGLLATGIVRLVTGAKRPQAPAFSS